MQARRERTRHLIELGGLVQKTGLVELVDDDRATLLGAFLALADLLREGQEEREGSGEGAGRSSAAGESRTPRQFAAAWRRRGLRAFDAEDASNPRPRP